MQLLGIALEKLRKKSFYRVVVDLGIRVKEIERNINKALPRCISGFWWRIRYKKLTTSEDDDASSSSEACFRFGILVEKNRTGFQKVT